MTARCCSSTAGSREVRRSVKQSRPGRQLPTASPSSYVLGFVATFLLPETRGKEARPSQKETEYPGQISNVPTASLQAADLPSRRRLIRLSRLRPSPSRPGSSPLAST